MPEGILEALKKKYDFLSLMLQSLEGAIDGVSGETDPDEVYETLVKYMGEFPTRAMLQKIADERGLGIRIRERKDAIRTIDFLSRE